ncbi:exocyst complex component 8 [Dendroctonus ponderosae]
MDVPKEPNFHLLSAPEFVPEKYVRTISHNYVGGSELKNLKKRIQALSDETNNSLKKNVYQNYVQFIDTGKEISHLESEMYQLSHLLSEQKSLLSALSATSILEDRTQVNFERNPKLDEHEIEEENKLKLATILEKVEGCKEIVEANDRVFIFEGDLLEIDATENTAIKFVHMYLFNDGLMVTNRNSNSRGLMRYAFESLYELSSLAVVNVRDLGNIKHAFKLLIFPDTRVFQCSSNASKKEWLDKIDQAKKLRLATEQQKKDQTVEKPSPVRAVSMDLSASKPEEVAVVHPEWLLDIPDELDVCVAQRQFEDAVNYLRKAQNYICKFNAKHSAPDAVILNIQEKVELKQNNLIDILMNELEVNPKKSFQGGLRATRTAVRLLNDLGRSTQCCDLFLKLCSTMLKNQAKKLKRETSTITYIRYFTSATFTNMCYMIEEFLRAFPDLPYCVSAYVAWAHGHLTIITNHFWTQVFVTKATLSTITECVQLIRAQCERLCEYGIDFRYKLDGQLRKFINTALNEHRDKFIDSIKLRANEDKWIPMNFKTKGALTRCLQEHEKMGLKLDSYVSGDVWLQLTSSNIAFTKLFLVFLDNCLNLQTTELLEPINDSLCSVFEAQVAYNKQALTFQPEQNLFVLKNIGFLLLVLVELTQRKYKESIGFECEPLNKLVNENSALLKDLASRNTKTKYSSDFL